MSAKPCRPRRPLTAAEADMLSRMPHDRDALSPVVERLAGDGVPLSQIASALGVPPQWVYQRWRRVRPSVCAVDGCGQPVKGRGLCSFHYGRARSGTPLDAPRQERNSGSPCARPGCSRPAVVRGMCREHYRDEYGRPARADLVPVTVRVSADVAESLSAVAEARGVSRPDVLREILGEWADRHRS